MGALCLRWLSYIALMDKSIFWNATAWKAVYEGRVLALAHRRLTIMSLKLMTQMVMQLTPTCDILEPLKIISMFRALLQLVTIVRLIVDRFIRICLGNHWKNWVFRRYQAFYDWRVLQSHVKIVGPILVQKWIDQLGPKSRNLAKMVQKCSWKKFLHRNWTEVVRKFQIFGPGWLVHSYPKVKIVTQKLQNTWFTTQSIIYRLRLDPSKEFVQKLSLWVVFWLRH